MTRIIPIADLDVPIPKIIQEADGDVNHALLLAASYGFALACKDLEKCSTDKQDND